MAASLNKVTLIGNLGQDPEIRTFESGATLARFTLATNETYKNKSGELVKRTEWHNITMWRGLAEVAEKYLKKGNRVYVEGKIRSRTYEDNDKIMRKVYEIDVNDMIMLSGPNDSSGQGGQSQSSGGNSSSQYDQAPPSQNQAQDNSAEMDDDLPF
ncbi:single-stranded DNA-binding protein [Salibacter sp.]|jgi:single-strand DNA-binding protein|uniref:single-stranded DNA-binding protein n=1 Tax=Salibacter sp. TaxID=2010995 RepID=UPI00287075E4|nr:single-stranded DNA-binding protein [Salibacter sp.]MDR9399049.1 single-stranded DNA-binding protein [Salibacter sp.]MDR9488086.1 single-stranded DNA-binding protein [Salibacter sp.]